MLSKNYKSCSDAASGPLKPGEIGVIEEDDHSGCPFHVRRLKPSSDTWWYQEAALKPVRTYNGIDGVPNPMEDEFEGVAFSRFPVSHGNWYAEVHVVRVGRTRPLLGWAVLAEVEGKQSLIRMAVLDGKGGRKVDVCLPERKSSEDEAENPEEANENPAGEKNEGDDDYHEEDQIENDEEEEEENNEGAGSSDDDDDDDEDDDGEGKNAEAAERTPKDIWANAESYGHRLQEGDVICCAATMPGGRLAFGLNGDFVTPMG